MASVVVTANTTPQTAFTVPVNKIGKIKLLEIDNQEASAITITILDAFTPTPSASDPSPSPVTVTRKVVTVDAGGLYTEKLDGYIEILGVCQVVASAVGANCNITVCYDFE